MDRAAWQATVHGVAKSRTQLKRLSTINRLWYIHIMVCKSPTLQADSLLSEPQENTGEYKRSPFLYNLRSNNP